ncbi:MAG: glycosyltransferase, partial [Patescibacteria group bacterium]
SGIPIDPVFYAEKNTDTIKQRLGVMPNAPIILVLSGGHGMAKIDETVTTLSHMQTPATIIAIAGDNPSLVKKLSALKIPKHIRFIPIGWTDTIDDYMRIADVIVTKAGGITVSECMAMGKPMILVSPIPGQEDHNARYVVEHGFGKIAANAEDVLAYVNEYGNGKKSVTTQQKTSRERAGKIILEQIKNSLY